MTPEQPFDGVTVVEFGQFIAVPFCAQLLAEGGARVIKIETLEGDPVRRLGQLAPGETRTYLSRNRGKQSLPLALRQPGAKPVIDALLREADVALMNFRPGLAEDLGLDPETLTREHPRLITGQVTPFGRYGPDAGLPGMDIVVQARSGLMVANGRTTEGRPVPGDPVAADYMCAMSLAFGISAALLRRERTGKGGQVHMSLMQAALTLNNNQMLRVDNVDGPIQQEALGELAQLRAEGAPYDAQRATLPSTRPSPMLKVYFRTYSTADGWIAIACGSHNLRTRFIKAIGLSDPHLEAEHPEQYEDHYEALRLEVETTIGARPTTEWQATLVEAGVPVSDVKLPMEMFDDEQPRANDMFHDLPHPALGNVRLLAPPVWMDEDGFQPGPPSAPFASEARSILASLGFDDGAIGGLVDDGVTREP